MKFLNQSLRLLRIQYILLRYNLDEVLFHHHRFFMFRFFRFLNPFYWSSTRKLPRAKRIRLAIEALGPIFVKAGQILSTRRDILPDDIALSLSKLQDHVTPFDGKRAERMVKKALQKPLHEVFSYFDTTPLASASIAQVHAATLITGESVVVKLLRPRIHKQMNADIALLRTFAKLAERLLKGAKQFKPRAMVNEIAETLTQELDLLREGANASQLRRNFANDPLLKVPCIYWEYSKKNMLIMEHMHGIPILQTHTLKNAGFNLEKIAETLITVFFTQVFRDNFFHADLHPGNLFVQPDSVKSPRLIAVDFGIVGSLSTDDQRYIAENMMAFFKRDYQRVAELHIASGWLPPHTRIDQFEGAIRAVSEPIFAQSFADISFGQLLMRLFQVAHHYKINIQPQLILLQKTILGMESLCRELAPQLNLWEIATPQIEKWLRQQVGVRAFFKRARANFPLWSEQLPELPGLFFDALKKIKNQPTPHEPKPAMRFTPLWYFLSGAAAASVVFVLTRL